jgi:hypothetical protein
MNIKVATVMVIGYFGMFLLGYWSALDDLKKYRRSRR